MKRLRFPLRIHLAAATTMGCLIAGCGSDDVKIAGGAESPPPKTERSKKAAEAEQKIIKSSKLR